TGTARALRELTIETRRLLLEPEGQNPVSLGACPDFLVRLGVIRGAPVVSGACREHEDQSELEHEGPADLSRGYASGSGAAHALGTPIASSRSVRCQALSGRPSARARS